MQTITVNASTSYDIHIGAGILSQTGAKIQAMGKVNKVCILSDSNVYPLYGKTVTDSLNNYGFEVGSFVFTAGENSKNGYTYLEILNFLAENQLTRTDLIIALGGGVVGDLAGFAAATYLRGIRYIQIPTTLLAAVDSSVGGKTAIDLPAGKNLAGAFYQPSLVLCDTDTLNTLPDEIFRDGCAEIIKYAILFDSSLFSLLWKEGMDFEREAVIARCIEHKKWIVEQDERDTGMRRMLNLGHTIGHGVETGSNYSLSHGKAVAIGMAIVTRAAVQRDFCEKCTGDRILTLLHQFGLPTTTNDTAQMLFSCALSDKKRNGNFVHLILPKAIGHCEIVTIPVSDLIAFIEDGLHQA